MLLNEIKRGGIRWRGYGGPGSEGWRGWDIGTVGD
jgi:hypothetical protein